jgi:hypothetical protein
MPDKKSTQKAQLEQDVEDLLGFDEGTEVCPPTLPDPDCQKLLEEQRKEQEKK